MALVNFQGDTLSPEDLKSLYGDFSSRTLVLGKYQGEKFGPSGFDPLKASEILANWLTGGGPPKPLDPSKLFGQAQASAGVEARGAAGQGIAGLFGFGKSIGSMAPMTSGVPYSAVPAPKVTLNPIFNPAYAGKFAAGGGR